jgi:formylglycine-generating enzyme required for sulfatase activity
MIQHNSFYRRSLAILALSCALFGCSVSTETPLPETPIEVPTEPPTEPPAKPPKSDPEITGFTFTQASPLWASQSGNGATAGSLSDPIGGTPPFYYFLALGAEGADNWRFMVSGNLLKILSGPLAAGAYSVRLGIADSKGLLYSRSEKITVAPDPAALSQEAQAIKGIDFKMRYVPSGAFIKPEKNMTGNPDIKVSIPIGFWMAETETTQELYEAVMGDNPSQFKNNAVHAEVQARRPVECVTWYEAVLFCNRLSIMTGKEAVYGVWGIADWEAYLEWVISSSSSNAIASIYADEKANGYRLPTIDEWLWAAMGADLQNPGQVNAMGAIKYYSGGPAGGTVEMEGFTWLYSNSSSVTHEVGKKTSNELGILDMTGNVMEWIYGASPDSNTHAYVAGKSYLDSVTLNNSPLYAIPHMTSNYRNPGIGFRIAHNQ